MLSKVITRTKIIILLIVIALLTNFDLIIKDKSFSDRDEMICFKERLYIGIEPNAASYASLNEYSGHVFARVKSGYTISEHPFNLPLNTQYKVVDAFSQVPYGLINQATISTTHFVELSLPNHLPIIMSRTDYDDLKTTCY